MFKIQTRWCFRTGMFACILVVCGCDASDLLNSHSVRPPIGADTPISVERIRGLNLKEIGSIHNAQLDWMFGDSTVEITHKAGVIPPQIVLDILGDDSTPLKIVASWELSQDNKQLRLFDIEVDGVTSNREAKLPISPAGPIRVNLGSRQYNIARVNKNRH